MKKKKKKQYLRKQAKKKLKHILEQFLRPEEGEATKIMRSIYGLFGNSLFK